MYGYSGTFTESDTHTGYMESAIPYSINCCGYAKIDDIDVSLNRTRIDFYLIYLINGAGHYITENAVTASKAGSIIIYRPNQHQHYYYKAAEKAELYWIHFTGSQIEKLMNELGFTGTNFFQVGIHTEYIELFEKIIHELQIKNPHFHQLCISYLLQLLASFSRDAGILKNAGKTPDRSCLGNAIKVMNEEFQNDHAIEYYAKECNLSIFQFIRSFKKYTEYSPAQYIEKLRITKAKEFLNDSSLTISEISSVVGYKDPFYFSKVFKKATGETPSGFRYMNGHQGTGHKGTVSLRSLFIDGS